MGSLGHWRNTHRADGGKRYRHEPTGIELRSLANGRWEATDPRVFHRKAAVTSASPARALVNMGRTSLTFAPGFEQVLRAAKAVSA